MSSVSDKGRLLARRGRPTWTPAPAATLRADHASGSGLYQRSLTAADHGDNTPQIINDRGNKSCRGRWPSTLSGADQEGNGGSSPRWPLGHSRGPSSPSVQYSLQQVESVHSGEVAQHRVVGKMERAHEAPSAPLSTSSARLTSSTSTPIRLAYGRSVVTPKSCAV